MALRNAEGQIVNALSTRKRRGCLNFTRPNQIPSAQVSFGVAEVQSVEQATAGRIQRERAVGAVVKFVGGNVHPCTPHTALRQVAVEVVAGTSLGQRHQVGEVPSLAIGIVTGRAVHAAVGACDQTKAAIGSDGHVRGGRKCGRGVWQLSEHTILDVPIAFHRRHPNAVAVAFARISHQRVGGTNLKFSATFDCHLLERPQVVRRGTPDAVASESRATFAAGAVKVGACADVEVSVASDGQGTDHQVGERRHLVPGVASVVGTPKTA